MLDLDELSVCGKANKVHFPNISNMINKFFARKEKEEKQITAVYIDEAQYIDTTDYDKLHHDHVQY